MWILSISKQSMAASKKTFSKNHSKLRGLQDRHHYQKLHSDFKQMDQSVHLGNPTYIGDASKDLHWYGAS